MKYFELVVPNTTPANFADNLATDIANLPPAEIIIGENARLEYVEISSEKSQVIPPNADYPHYRLEIHAYTLRVSQLNPIFPEMKMRGILGYGRTLGVVIRAEMREMTPTMIRFLGTCEEFMASYMSFWLRQAITVHGARPVNPVGVKVSDIVQPALAQLTNIGNHRDGLGEESKQTLLKSAQSEMRGFKSLVERQTYKDIFANGKPQENIARALLQTFLIRRSYREVEVRGGRSDLLVFVKQGRFLYETKIWRGCKYYQQGLREIEEYIIGENDDQRLLRVFYIIFDSTKSRRAGAHRGGDFTIEVVGDRNVEVVIVNLLPPQPSTKSP